MNQEPKDPDMKIHEVYMKIHEGFFIIKPFFMLFMDFMYKPAFRDR